MLRGKRILAIHPRTRRRGCLSAMKERTHPQRGRTRGLALAILLSGLLRAFPGELIDTDVTALRAAKPGQSVFLSIVTNLQQLPLLPVQVARVAGPQFLFSDKPETFFTNGIALRETVRPGAVRLYFYHVPEPSPRGKVISVVIENPGSEPLQLRTTRSIFPRPGGNYHRVAQEALLSFMAPVGTAEAARVIPAGGRILLDPRLEQAVAKPDQLVHGIYEFEVSHPARVSVLQHDPGQESLQVLDQLPRLPGKAPGSEPPSGAGRGYFEVSNFEVTSDPGGALQSSNLPARLIIADGRRDAWIRGRDSIANLEAVNVGNYGVKYRLRLRRQGGDGRALAVVLCKLDVVNQWCGAVAAAMMVNSGPSSGQVVRLPSDKPLLRERGEACVVCTFPPLAADATQEIDLEYSPPGAACLPTPFLLLPFDP